MVEPVDHGVQLITRGRRQVPAQSMNQKSGQTRSIKFDQITYNLGMIIGLDSRKL